MSSITISHSHAEGTRIEGSSRGDGVWEIVGPLGWRYSRNVGIYVRGSRDRDPNRPLIGRTRAALETAGHTVTEQLDDTPRPAAVRRAALDERAADRADRYDDRVDRHAAEADRRYNAEHRILDGIPAGQPVLVDHHSGPRHARALQRAESHRRAGSDAAARAQHAADRADGARAHAAHRNDPRAIMRRIETLEADVRRHEREQHGYTRVHRNSSGDVVYREEHPAATGRRADDLARWIDRDREEITHLRGELAAMADAGTFTAWTPADFQRGDRANVRGRWCEVARVNRKSVSVLHRFDWLTDQDKPTPVPFDEIHGRRRGELQWDSPAGEPWPVDLARKVARWQQLQHSAAMSEHRTVSLDSSREAQRVHHAVRLVHGLDTAAGAAQVAAIVDTITGTPERRNLAAAYLAAYNRLTAGETGPAIAATLTPITGAPAWTIPTDREPEERRAGPGWPRTGLPLIQPGDLVAGIVPGHRDAGAPLDRTFCGPVSAVSDVHDRRERGQWITITLDGGDARTLETTRRLAVHPAGTWETDQTATPQAPAAMPQTFTDESNAQPQPAGDQPAPAEPTSAVTVTSRHPQPTEGDVRYHLSNGWFVDRNQQANRRAVHDHPYSLWAPGSGPGGTARLIGTAPTLTAILATANHMRNWAPTPDDRPATQPAGRYEITCQPTPRPHAVQDQHGRVRVRAAGRHGWAHLAHTEWDDDQPTNPDHPVPTVVINYAAGRADPDPHAIRDARGRVRVCDTAHTTYDRYGWAHLANPAWDDPDPATTHTTTPTGRHTPSTDAAGSDVCALDGMPFPCAEA